MWSQRARKLAKPSPDLTERSPSQRLAQPSQGHLEPSPGQPLSDLLQSTLRGHTEVPRHAGSVGTSNSTTLCERMPLGEGRRLRWNRPPPDFAKQGLSLEEPYAQFRPNTTRILVENASVGRSRPDLGRTKLEPMVHSARNLAEPNPDLVERNQGSVEPNWSPTYNLLKPNPNLLDSNAR